MKPIFLFDVDGVLIQPRGYQVSVMEACTYFAHHLGYSDFGFQIEMFEIFESNGITSEFDMVPLFILNLIDHSLGVHAVKPAPGKLSDYKGVFSGLSCPSVSIRLLVEMIGEATRPGEYPSQSALRLFKAGKFFPQLVGAAVVEELLANSRSVYKSVVAAIFQNIVLGDRLFEKTYRVSPQLERQSALTQNDVPLLSKFHAEWLLNLWRNESLDAALMTLRPSCPPREIGDTLPGYSPEAELGVQLVGWAELPLVGFGQLDFCATQMGLRVEAFAKPAQGHALAALTAAVFREELTPIELALGYEAGKNALHYLTQESPLSMHVFEDSSSGIVSAQALKALLRSVGADVDLKIWGIGTQPAKISVLERLGAQVFPDINQALDHVLGTI